VSGGGAIEVELSRAVDDVASRCPGIEQYAVRQYALALDSLPKQITDNAGLKVGAMIVSCTPLVVL